MIRTSNQFVWVALLFYGTIVFLILITTAPKLPDFPPEIWRQLLKGQTPFNPIGFDFAPYKRLLPPGEKISFIMDHHFNPYGRDIINLYTAQSYLVPFVLTYETNQRAAIVYCSNKDIANIRMNETGYRLLVALGDGKGIAVKTS